MQVWIDADACPRSVMQCIKDLQTQFGFGVTTIASVNHFFDGDDHITVGPEPQATDMAIVNRVASGDLVVTQDWGLAALVMAKGASAISPDGRIYQPDKIEFMLEQRNVLARYRRSGGRTKGPAPRTIQDDERFRFNFLKLVSE